MNRNSLSKVFALIITMAIFVSLTACGVRSKQSAPEKVAENFVVALFTANPEKMVNSMPNFALKEAFGITDKEEIINSMKEMITEDDISDCVIVSSKKEDPLSVLSYGLFTSKCEDLLNEYIEDMESYGATSQDLTLIDEYCIVSVESIVDDEERTDFIFCAKYDGEWYVVDIY